MRKYLMPNISQQKGFSIVELMIAGLLGIVLLGGVLQLFLGSNQNYTMQDELASIQEDGRFALMFLNNEIQLAGLAETDLQEIPNAIDFNNSTDGGAGNDTFAVAYNLVADGIDNIDCNGAFVGDGKVINQYSVNGNNELVCRGVQSGAPGQPLISGVESFQVLYGVETELVCPDGTANSYMTAAEVVAANLTERVFSVRIGLLLTSSSEILQEDNQEQFQVLDLPLSFNDRNVRRLFQNTIYMRNAAANFVQVDLQQSQGCAGSL